MSNELKKLGASLIAVLALSLVITSIAAAANFTASSYPVFYEGKGSSAEYGSATTEAGNVECKSGTASGTLSEASSTVSISGSASECSAFGFLSATVNANGCTTLVHVKEGSGDAYTGIADLVCPAGKSVVTTAGTCEMQTPPQTGNVTVDITNNTAEGTVSVKLNNQKVKYNVTKDGFGCPFNGTGEKTGGTTGLKTVTVKVAGNKIDIG
jgi:hypothetical protein